MDVLWRIFEVLVNVFEHAVICYFIQKHFPGRFSQKGNWLVNAAAVTVIAGVYTSYLYFPPTWILDTVSIHLFWLLYTILLRKGSWYEKSFWCVLLVSVTSICSVAAVSWAMYITGASQNTVVFGHGIFRFLLVTCTKAINFISLYYFSKLYISSQSVHKNIYITLLSLPILCSYIDNTLMDIGSVMGENVHLMLYVALSALCVMAILMVAYYLYFRISKQGELLLKTQGELQHKTMMEQHNDELIKIHANMNTWRHDFHNHLQTLMVLSRMGNSSELKYYVEILGEKLTDVDVLCHTGHQAFDAIVMAKCALAKAEGIAVNIHTTPVPVIPINDVDVISIVGNLFDNSIESCRRVDIKKRSVDLFFGMMESMVCVRISNATDGKVRKENDKYVTTKKQNGLHGIGLASVDRIVGAAGGQVHREHHDNVFTTTLLLPVKK